MNIPHPTSRNQNLESTSAQSTRKANSTLTRSEQVQKILNYHLIPIARRLSHQPAVEVKSRIKLYISIMSLVFQHHPLSPPLQV